MNGTVAKKIRKELRKQREQDKTNIALGIKQWVNKLPLKDRLRIAYRIVRRRF